MNYNLRNLTPIELKGQLSLALENLKDTTLEISMKHETRLVLINWIMAVCNNEKLLPETIFRTIRIMDKFLSKNKVKEYHLFAIACFSIATKLEEGFDVSYRLVKNLPTFCNHQFQPYEISNMEILIISSLDYKVSEISPYDILQISWTFIPNSNHKVRCLSEYVLTIGSTSTFYNQTHYSALVLASNYIANTMLGFEVSSIHNISEQFEVDFELEVMPCIKSLNKMAVEYDHKRKGPIYTRYSKIFQSLSR
jgi:hypothetical protein